MKPISSGRGNNIFTLYYPFSIRSGVAPFDLKDFIVHLGDSLPETISIESVEGKGTNIFKLSGITSFDEATKLFNQLKRVFLFLSIESDIAIYIYDSLTNIEKPFAHFPPSWPDGIKAGWQSENGSEQIKIDGIAHIIYPVIVPEQKKIVESGALIGHINRNINSEIIPEAISFSKNEQAQKNYRKGELAAKAYINAFSHENPSLRFLSLVTCLEILAEPKDKSTTFINVAKACVEEINSMPKYNNEEIRAFQSIASIVGNLKKQSIKEALEDLIDESNELVSNALPYDHPHKSNPKKAIVDMYSIRSKVAHSGSLGKSLNEKIHRSNQFAHCAAKALLKAELNFA